MSTYDEDTDIRGYDIYRWSTDAWLGSHNGESALDAYNSMLAKAGHPPADELPEDILILALAGPVD